jgi:hypothetical protein
MEYSEGFDRVIVPIIERACVGERAADKYSWVDEFVYLIDTSKASGTKVYTFGSDWEYLDFKSIQSFKKWVNCSNRNYTFTSENNLLTVSDGTHTWTVFVLPDYAGVLDIVNNCTSVYNYHYDNFKFDSNEDKKLYSFMDGNYGVDPWIKDWCDFSYLVPVKVR